VEVLLVADVDRVALERIVDLANQVLSDAPLAERQAALKAFYSLTIETALRSSESNAMRIVKELIDDLEGFWKIEKCPECGVTYAKAKRTQTTCGKKKCQKARENRQFRSPFSDLE
jgi:hypothetical protein